MVLLPPPPRFHSTDTDVVAKQIRDAHGNEYGKPQDVVGEQRTVFTSHSDAAFDVCFENLLTGCKSTPLRDSTQSLFDSLLQGKRENINVDE